MDQLIAELTSEHGADLRHLFGSIPEPVEAGDQRGMQCGWDRERHFGHRRDGSSLQNCFCQLFQEERHTIAALDNRLRDIVRQRRLRCCQPLYERSGAPPVKTVQR